MQTDTARRCIGLDVHREFAQVAIWQGGLVTLWGSRSRPELVTCGDRRSTMQA